MSQPQIPVASRDEIDVFLKAAYDRLAERGVTGAQADAMLGTKLSSLLDESGLSQAPAALPPKAAAVADHLRAAVAAANRK